MSNRIRLPSLLWLYLSIHTVISASSLLKDKKNEGGISVNRNLDRFNYYKTNRTIVNGEIVNDFGPDEWQSVECLDMETCTGFPDKFERSQGWEINSTNHCQWCPEGAEVDTCGMHHQSPINVQRNKAIPGYPDALECQDGHGMSFHDSSCSWEELKEQNAFVIDRHALRIKQPLEYNLSSSDVYAHIACTKQQSIRSRDRQFGRMDFAEGFPDWWLLSHIDFHVPSEHTQDGKRYSGEIQLYHFYEIDGNIDSVHNEMATASVFLEVYNDTSNWEALDKVICAWREAEEINREACGLPSINVAYGFCTNYTRGHNKKYNFDTPAVVHHVDGYVPPTETTSEKTKTSWKMKTNTTTTTDTTNTKKTSWTKDVQADSTTNNKVSGEWMTGADGNLTFVEGYWKASGDDGHYIFINKTTTTTTSSTDEKTNENTESRALRSRREKSEYIPAKSVYDIGMDNIQHVQNGQRKDVTKIVVDSESKEIVRDLNWKEHMIKRRQLEHTEQQIHRKLENYDHVSWYNYFPLSAVKTEYYHRYYGAQTIPPCYGKWILNERKQTNHWRIMKDPIRVTENQIMELHRLLRERITPVSDTINACQHDTAAAPDQTDPLKVNVARPLQTSRAPHFATFCECQDWDSYIEEDKQWCARTSNTLDRLYTHPYNFMTDGF